LLINLNLIEDEEWENMPKQNDRISEEIFSKLSDYGYSKKAAATIWLWYHSSEKDRAVSNFKPFGQK